ncbi:MAG TPA: amidase, partial [Chloroflexota bacterium]|nr:amidase [Chloroflexota bacterium]
MPFGIEGRSAAELIEEALTLYARTEPLVRAFAWLDEERARRLAQDADAQPPEKRERLRLWGVPVGIKDIVDTAGIPTECGSALFAGRVPERSAPLMQRLEADGALMVGKTVTTECAYFHPGPTRNPWDVRRTSGGSSMGSAAAVAMGVIPAAIGSQTNGSVIRPAAYCGVVGFKPTHGRIPTEGVMAFAPTLDTIGTFTRSAADAARLAAVMTAEPVHTWWDPSDVLDGGGDGVLRVRLAAVRTAEWSHAEPAMRGRFEADLAALADAGAEITDESLPDGMDECVPIHRTIMQYESKETLGALIEEHPERASDTLREYVRGGAAIARAEYEAALKERDRLIAAFAAWARPFDAIVTPPTTGEAPTPETTGDPRFCTRWTLVGAPAIT